MRTRRPRRPSRLVAPTLTRSYPVPTNLVELHPCTRLYGPLVPPLEPLCPLSAPPTLPHSEPRRPSAPNVVRVHLARRAHPALRPTRPRGRCTSLNPHPHPSPLAALVPRNRRPVPPEEHPQPRLVRHRHRPQVPFPVSLPRRPRLGPPPQEAPKVGRTLGGTGALSPPVHQHRRAPRRVRLRELCRRLYGQRRGRHLVRHLHRPPRAPPGPRQPRRRRLCRPLCRLLHPTRRPSLPSSAHRRGSRADAQTPQIEDADVCAGAVGTQAPILAHDLRSIALASPAAKNFCTTIFGLCPLPNTIPHTVNLTGAPATADADQPGAAVAKGGRRRVKKRWESKGREPFKVVHISDVHVDRSYAVRSAPCPSRRACLADHLARARTAWRSDRLHKGHLLPQLRARVAR